MRKFLVLCLAVIMSIGAKAQFKQGQMFVNTSMSGMGLSYSKDTKFTLNLDVQGGYYIADGMAVTAKVGYAHQYKADAILLGAGLRYTLPSTNLFLSLGADFEHYADTDIEPNNFSVPVELGYTLFINRALAFEPAVYWKTSLSDFSNKSAVGMRLGLTYFFHLDF